jgi:predicted chitinase
MATNQLTSKQLRNILIAELNAQGITGEQQAAILGQVKKEMLFEPKYLVEIASDKSAENAYGLASPKKARELGNTNEGDGAKYKGRGFIQLTGRNNYKKVGEELFLDGVIDDPDLLITNPDILKTNPSLAAKASVKFLTIDPRFQDALSKPTLRGKVDGLTRIINGGLFSDPSKKHEGGMTYQEDIDLRFKNAENFNKQLTLNSNGIEVAVDGIIDPKGQTETAWNKYSASLKPANLPPIGSGSTYSMTPQQMESKVYPPSISDAPYPEVSDRYKMELLSKPNVNSPAGVKRVQAQIGADVDGVWGKQSQDLFDMHNRQAYDNKVRPPSDTYRQEGFQRQAPRNPSLVEQGVNAIIPSAQAAAMPVAPPEKQYMTMEELLIDKDLMQNPLLFNDADAKRMWERF